MSSIWILAGLALIAAIVVIVSWRRRGQDVDLGAVSHQWMAEHRLGQTHDRQS